jgi:hypothetical protein
MTGVDEANGVAARKPYAEPSIVHYGSIAKLTQGVTGSLTDGSGMVHRMTT